MSNFSPSQLNVLNALYAQAGAETVPGAWLVPGSVTVDRVDVNSFLTVFASASGAGIPKLTKTVTVAVAGQTDFAVAPVPYYGSTFLVFVNNALKSDGVDYTYAGNVVTFLAALSGGETVQVYYSA